MILKNEDLNIAVRFKVEGFHYTISATTEAMKCFGCGQEGHLVHSCPERAQELEAEAAQSVEGEAEVWGCRRRRKKHQRKIED